MGLVPVEAAPSADFGSDEPVIGVFRVIRGSPTQLLGLTDVHAGQRRRLLDGRVEPCWRFDLISRCEDVAAEQQLEGVLDLVYGRTNVHHVAVSAGLLFCLVVDDGRDLRLCDERDELRLNFLPCLRSTFFRHALRADAGFFFAQPFFAFLYEFWSF